MVKIRPSKFGSDQKKKRNRAVARKTNAKHHKLGLFCSSTTDPRTAPSARPLSRLKQEYTYPDVVKMSDFKCKNLLVTAGILPPKKFDCLCFVCGEMMYAASSSSGGGQSSDVAQRPQCRTSGRHALQLRSASLAWTPFWKSATRGNEPRYALWLRVAFCVGLRMPVDIMQHMVRDGSQTLGRRQLEEWVQDMHFCLAFAAPRVIIHVLIAVFTFERSTTGKNISSHWLNAAFWCHIF